MIMILDKSIRDTRRRISTGRFDGLVAALDNSALPFPHLLVLSRVSTGNPAREGVAPNSPQTVSLGRGTRKNFFIYFSLFLFLLFKFFSSTLTI